MLRIRALRVLVSLALGLVLVAGAGGCAGITGGGSSSDDGNSSGTTTITVGNRPTADEKAQRAQFDKDVKTFEKDNPHIILKPTETGYDPQTFQTLLAGGNLPDVLSVPFTEPQALIAHKQIADITDAVHTVGLDKVLNPVTLGIVQDSSKRIYGIPTGAYAVGLNYNRKLFREAGLDPNKPPQTWDEVRADAKIITKKTGATGYAMMSSKACGGWMFTAMTYAFGGQTENAAGTKAVFADSEAATKAMDLVHAMKWDDQTMGKQNLYDCDSIVQAGASGKVGMYLRAPDVYAQSVVQYGMNPDDFGAAGMPIYQGEQRRTLTGGSAAIVSPKATEAQKVAAVKWINFESLKQYTDKSLAISKAKAARADKIPVAIPGLTPVSERDYKQYLNWVKPYNNVPVANFDPYMKAQAGQTISPEPPNSAQMVYQALDSVIQKVLSDRNANIPGLLQAAQRRVTTQLGQR